MIPIVATFCCGTFFGAAIYISVAQHPASLQAGQPVAAAFFPHMYRRAAPMQIAMAVLGAGSGIAAWFYTGAAAWLAGAIALFSAIPITLLFIKPINDRLLDTANVPDSTESAKLLSEWGKRHWIRSAVSGVAFLLYLIALSR